MRPSNIHEAYVIYQKQHRNMAASAKRAHNYGKSRKILNIPAGENINTSSPSRVKRKKRIADVKKSKLSKTKPEKF